MKNNDLVSQRDIEIAKEKTKKGLKSAFAIDCYKSDTDNEIGRNKEHAKHMRKTRRANFTKKMELIDPHYGKKAASILAAGTAAGLAATALPGVGPVAGPTVGGAVIAGGLAFLETDAHRSVGDHAILDSLLEDRDDNWRTNATLHGYNGHGDRISEFDAQQMLTWSDDDDNDLDNLLPDNMKNEKNISPNVKNENTTKLPRRPSSENMKILIDDESQIDYFSSSSVANTSNTNQDSEFDFFTNFSTNDQQPSNSFGSGDPFADLFSPKKPKAVDYSALRIMNN